MQVFSLPRFYTGLSECGDTNGGCPVGCSVGECDHRDPMWVEKRERMSEPIKEGKEMKEYQKHPHICMLLKKKTYVLICMKKKCKKKISKKEATKPPSLCPSGSWWRKDTEWPHSLWDRYDLRLAVPEGKQVLLYPEKEEPKHILNIKRGIISALLLPPDTEEAKHVLFLVRI